MAQIGQDFTQPRGVRRPLHLPDISEASGVGVPSSVDGADGVDGGSPGAGEGALLPQVPLGAVPGDAGAQAGDLLVFSWLMLDAAGNVCPCAVLLKKKTESNALVQVLLAGLCCQDEKVVQSTQQPGRARLGRQFCCCLVSLHYL